MGLRTLDPNHGTAKHIHLESFSKGGKLHSDKSNYKDGDNGEDILMFDKKTGELVAQMRYNERIFDQEATKKIDKLAIGGNYEKLGRFVASELRTHKDYTSRFEDGGLLKSLTETQRVALRNRFGDITKLSDAQIRQFLTAYDKIIERNKLS